MGKLNVCLALAVSVAATACSDSTPATPSPTPSTCTFVVNVSGSQFGPDGGSAAATVSAPARCAWSASSNADWVKLQGTASGMGDGTVPLSISALDGAADRTATLTVAQTNFTLTQNGCVVRLSAAEVRLPDTGGSSDLEIDTQPGCSWRVEGDLSWAAFDPPTGRGASTVRVNAPRNQSSSREVDVQVGAQAVKVHQDGPMGPSPNPGPGPAACVYSIDSPVEVLVPIGGAVGRVGINTSPGCAWSATSTQPWARIRSVTSGTGAARVEYEVDRNTANYQSDLRKAGIEIRWPSPTQGQNVWLSQFADCNSAFYIYPGNQRADLLPFGPEGGTQTVQHLVDPAFSCTWRIEGGADWITIPLREQIRRGDGDFRVVVPPNPSALSRTTVFQVGERPIAVFQAGRQ